MRSAADARSPERVLVRFSGDGAPVRDDPAARETIPALLPDHMHHRHQEGLRDAAALVARSSRAKPTRELDAVGRALDELVRRDDADQARSLGDWDAGPAPGALTCR